MKMLQGMVMIHISALWHQGQVASNLTSNNRHGGAFILSLISTFCWQSREGEVLWFSSQIRAGRSVDNSAQQTIYKTHVIVARAPVSSQFHLQIGEGGEEPRLELQPWCASVCLHEWLSPSRSHIQPPNLATWEAELQLQFSPLRDDNHKWNKAAQKHEKILCFYAKYSFPCGRKHQCLLKLFYSSPSWEKTMQNYSFSTPK